MSPEKCQVFESEMKNKTKLNETKKKNILYINRCFITTDSLTYKKHYNTGAGGGVRSCGLGNKKKKSKNLLHKIMHSSPHLFMNVFLILLGINWHIQLMSPFKYHV